MPKPSVMTLKEAWGIVHDLAMKAHIELSGLEIDVKEAQAIQDIDALIQSHWSYQEETKDGN